MNTYQEFPILGAGNTVCREKIHKNFARFMHLGGWDKQLKKLTYQTVLEGGKCWINIMLGRELESARGWGATFYHRNRESLSRRLFWS